MYKSDTGSTGGAAVYSKSLSDPDLSLYAIRGSVALPKSVAKIWELGGDP